MWKLKLHIFSKSADKQKFKSSDTLTEGSQGFSYIDSECSYFGGKFSNGKV